MTRLARQWAGQFYGTHTGRSFVTFEGSSDTNLDARLRLNEDRAGLTSYEGKALFDGSTIQIKATSGDNCPPLLIRGKLTSNGSIAGNWETEVGSAGTFAMFPHDLEQNENAVGETKESLHTAVRDLGALRIYGPDFARLVGALRKDFRTARIYVTTRGRGADRTVDLEQFLQESRDDDPRIEFLKMNVQERETPNVNRVVELLLDNTSGNRIFVQGAQETWVRGEADFLRSALRPAEHKSIGFLKQHGLNLNGIILLFGIAALPELGFVKRLAFLGILLAIILTIAGLHRALVNLTVIQIGEERPTFLKKYSAEVVSTIIGTIAAVIATTAFSLLTGGVGAVFGPLTTFFSP